MKEPAQEESKLRAELISILRHFEVDIKLCQEDQRNEIINQYVEKLKVTLGYSRPKEQAKTEGLVAREILSLSAEHGTRSSFIDALLNKYGCQPTGRLVPTLNEIHILINDFCNKNSLLYDGSRNLAKAIHALISQPAPQPEAKEQDKLKIISQLRDFASKVSELPGEINKIIDENFWELVESKGQEKEPSCE